MKNENASAMPKGDHNNIQPEYGMSKIEHVLLQITCAYITAGSAGMPDHKDILRYARETTIEYFKALERPDLTNQ